MSECKFKRLTVEGWRQFDSVDIELHPNLTILTGANGAGKSTLLRIFSQHFGYSRPFLATPQRTQSGGIQYITGLFSSLWNTIRPVVKQNITNVGTLSYTNSQNANLTVPENGGVQYNISISGQQQISGIHIDSHQPIPVYQQVGQIPTTNQTNENIYNQYNSEMNIKYQGSHSQFSPTYRMKESLISMALFGEGTKHVQGNPETLKAFNGFIDVLRKVLPPTLGFIDISIRPPDVVLVTKSGEFLIDAASGGVMTLIDFAWRLHMFSLVHNSFVVTIDEPENHLHPTMQRTLMKRLIATFPQAQFIMATHSPFMVSSVKESNVYVLRYINSNTGAAQSEQIMPSQTTRVLSQHLDTVNKAATANEILREVLGVSATMPEWVETDIKNIVARYRALPIDEKSLKQLRGELEAMGSEEFYPSALAELTRGQ